MARQLFHWLSGIRSMRSTNPLELLEKVIEDMEVLVRPSRSAIESSEDDKLGKGRKFFTPRALCLVQIPAVPHRCEV
jgi:hypothetical protein